METQATHLLRQMILTYATNARACFVRAYLRKHEEVIAVAVEKVLALRERHPRWSSFNDVADAVKTHLGEHALLVIALSAESEETWWDDALQSACTDVVAQTLPYDDGMYEEDDRRYLAGIIIKRCYLAGMCRNVRRLWLRRNKPSKLRLPDLQK